MCWFQGEDDPGIPDLNRECIKRWRTLNPDWEVILLTEKTISEYAPEFFDINALCSYPQLYTKQSNLLRFLLLSKFGGVWVDSSVYPVVPLSDFYDDIVNDTGFFTYRFMPRSHSKMGIRETVTWFLVADKPHNYVIDKWLYKYIATYITINTKWKPFYRTHMLLCELYDSDPQIKYIVDNMVQISEKYPHSLQKSNLRPLDVTDNHYMYKRPNIWK